MTAAERLRVAAVAGIKRGARSYAWVCKIVIPVSFLVTLLQWTGWLGYLDFLLKPLMGLLNLPPEAALPILTGMLINIYAVIAILAVIPFSVGQMTLIAIFNLIAHGLILEGIVQQKSGINIVRASLVRIIAAIVTVLVVSRIIGATGQSVAMPSALIVQKPVLEVLQTWAIDMLWLLLKILLIIMSVMTALEISRAMGWIEYVQDRLRPALAALGLSRRTGVMFVAGIVFGLLYGGAVIVEEARKGTLTRQEIEHLHISLGINHAMIEDPALFLALGVNPFWLWVPRIVTAAVAVQGYSLAKYLRNKLRRRAAGVH